MRSKEGNFRAIGSKKSPLREVIAEAWVMSRTGKRDGRLWHELMSDEQDTYRERYKLSLS